MTVYSHENGRVGADPTTRHTIFDGAGPSEGGCAPTNRATLGSGGKKPAPAATMRPLSPLLLLALLTPAAWSCQSAGGGSTWEEDRRQGIGAGAPLTLPAPSKAAFDAREMVAAPPPVDPEQVAHDLEMALLRFTARRRAVSAESGASGSRWPRTLTQTWRSILRTLEAGFASTPHPMPGRLLIQTRVTLEAELELCARQHGPTPKEVKARVQAIWLTVAQQMRARRPRRAPDSRTSSGAIALTWPVSPIVVTSPFGFRRDPILGSQQVRFHAGLDLGGRRGDIVLAAGSGKVTGARWQGGHGRTITVQHAGGYSTRYAHLARMLVSVGVEVEAGQAIGLMGSTGRSTGPHLHFEVMRGSVPVDPFEVLRSEPSPFAAK